MAQIRVGILTVSDRSAEGSRPDTAGPLVEKKCRELGWLIQVQDIVADDIEKISSLLIKWSDELLCNLILTVGGTGFTERDNTPEATRLVIDKNAPGLSEGMRFYSFQITPHALLSRGISGIRNKTLIINLPGSPKAATENLEFIAPVLPHAISLIIGDLNSEEGHSKTYY